MDTRSKKWTNTILVTFVIIVMTLSGMYGISTIHNMALTGNSSFTVDELDQIDYIKRHRHHYLTNGQSNKVQKLIPASKTMCQRICLQRLKMNPE